MYFCFYILEDSCVILRVSRKQRIPTRLRFVISQNKAVKISHLEAGERGGSVAECRTPEREVGGSKHTSAVLCP